MQETAEIVLNALLLVRLLAPNSLPHRSTEFQKLANVTDITSPWRGL